VFLLLEDETGTVNAIVRPEVYEAHRALVRADPLLACRGRLERRDRNVNVLVERIEAIRIPDSAGEGLPAEDPAEARIRAAVPAGQQFGRGRR
jgi:error-prone DNA polymerase